MEEVQELGLWVPEYHFCCKRHYAHWFDTQVVLMEEFKKGKPKKIEITVISAEEEAVAVFSRMTVFGPTQ
jgi:hypothetical protein